jgi:hypothetical protein
MTDTEEKRPQALWSILAAISLCGFIVSVVVNGLSYFSFSILEGSKTAIFMLHGGIFVLVLPVIIQQRRRLSQREISIWDRRRTFDSLQEDNPPWVRRGLLLLGVFFGLNFIFLIFHLGAGTAEKLADGTYAVMNHGKFVRFSTAQEFHQHQVWIGRMFSAGWMYAYSYFAAHYNFFSNSAWRTRHTSS